MKSKSELEKLLYKEYWRNKQTLYYSSMEVIDYNSPNSGPFSIYSVHPKTREFETFLFEVQNYNVFEESIFPIRKSILYPEKFEYKSVWDVTKASSSVFFNARERLYTIPKFSSITKEDIGRCIRHFTRQYISTCMFNFKWFEFEEESKQEKFDF